MRRELLIEAGAAPAPLAAVLAARLEAMGQSQAQALVQSGQVFVDGRRCRDPAAAIGPGQRLVIHLGEARPGPAPLELLHEDQHFLAVNKRPGEHVNETETSGMESIVARLADRDAYVVHRLDRETSGVLVLAKGRAMAAELSRELQLRRVHKTYVALARGTVEDGELDGPIGADKRRPRARRVRPDGQEARTRVRTIARLGEVSSICAEPITGRTHQIRVHLSHAGAPILGDLLYGGPANVRLGPAVYTPGRVMLHARRLELTVRGRTHRLEAPFPDDFRQAERLGLAIEPVVCLRSPDESA